MSIRRYRHSTDNPFNGKEPLWEDEGNSLEEDFPLYGRSSLDDIFVQKSVYGTEIQFGVSGAGKCVSGTVHYQFFLFTFGCMVQLVQHIERDKSVL